HRLIVGVRARKAQRLVQRAELLAAATARAPAGAQEPLALGRGVGPEGLAQLGQAPDGARALGNTAGLAPDIRWRPSDPPWSHFSPTRAERPLSDGTYPLAIGR